jgi:uncharacterized protein YegJ (DUF2314 family)
MQGESTKVQTTDGKTPWVLDDASELAARYPYTFYKPSPQAIARLKAGDLVKLIFSFQQEDAPVRAERMWVIIKAIDGDGFSGALDNDPLHIQGLVAGDRIEFDSRHIIDVSIDDPVPDPTGPYWARCFVTNRVLQDRQPIGYLYREKPDADKSDDSGWRIFCGDESDEYMDDPANISYVALGAILTQDDSILELLSIAPPCAFSRDDGTDYYHRVEPPEDR